MPTLDARATKEPRAGLRIVVADDDRDAVLMLSTLLQQEGHTVIEVYQADAVIEVVVRYKPDAVLLDIRMPGITGFEIARRLRNHLGHACPLLVAITAWKHQEAKELGKLFGFSHHLTKPYSTQDLLDVLASLTVSGRAL